MNAYSVGKKKKNVFSDVDTWVDVECECQSLTGTKKKKKYRYMCEENIRLGSVQVLWKMEILEWIVNKSLVQKKYDSDLELSWIYVWKSVIIYWTVTGI